MTQTIQIPRKMPAQFLRMIMMKFKTKNPVLNVTNFPGIPDVLLQVPVRQVTGHLNLLKVNPEFPDFLEFNRMRMIIAMKIQQILPNQTKFGDLLKNQLRPEISETAMVQLLILSMI